jgi:hypothetical protein
LSPTLMVMIMSSRVRDWELIVVRSAAVGLN